MKTADGCPYPEDRLYVVENDLWFKQLSAGRFRIGVTLPYLFFSGKPNRVTVRGVGSLVRKNTSLALLISIKMEGAVVAPFDCEVKMVNAAALANPALVADDPYGEGWLAEVSSSEPSGMVNAREAAKKYEEINRERGVVCLQTVPDYEVKVFGQTCESILTQIGDFMKAYMSFGETLHVITSDPATEVDMISWAGDTGQGLLEVRRVGKTLHVLYRRLV